MPLRLAPPRYECLLYCRLPTSLEACDITLRLDRDHLKKRRIIVRSTGCVEQLLP